MVRSAVHCLCETLSHTHTALARRVWAEASAGELVGLIANYPEAHVRSAKEDDSTDGETHETAMQKAAAERRRSSAGKSRTPSPVKPNAVAGPGPKSSAQSQRFIVVDDDSPPESVASRPGSSASHRRASKPARGTPVADPPAAAAIRKSAFSATEEPGSWGNAVPMGSQRPKSKPATPVSRVQTSSPAPALGDWGNAAPMSIGKSVVRQEVPAAPASSTSQLAPASSSTAFEAPSSPSALATADSVANPRKGPTWTTSAPVTEAVAPVSERVPTPPVGQVQTVDMPDVMAEADNGPIPGPAEGSLVAETADIEAASPAPVVDIGVTPTAAPVPVEVGASPTDSVMEVDPDSETVVDLPHLAGNDATIDVEIEADLPLANTTYERLEQAIESIEDGVHDVAIDRDTRSQSSSSIEAIPEEVARTQACFAARPVVEVQPSTGTATVLDLFRNSPNPPRRPRLSANTTRQPSASSSSSGSPSKRQSSRLSSKSIQKSIQPVYSFKRNTYNPVQWRHVIEMDGESLPEDSSSAGSTRPSSIELLGTTVDGARMFKVTAFVETPTPIDRLSQAIRIPDTRLIDEWNKQAPSMTNNHALHRMIFESYIDMSVGGAEPTIGVDNTVDEEQIPPRFEFQYSNEMLYHKDVPDPELGKGCGCDGPCSDKSNSCSCLARQALYNYDVIDGFAYDKKGILKNSTGIPIWECGPNCGCPPECMNRVVQRGRSNSTVVDLFKTVSLHFLMQLCFGACLSTSQKKKGWGEQTSCAAQDALPACLTFQVFAPDTISQRGPSLVSTLASSLPTKSPRGVECCTPKRAGRESPRRPRFHPLIPADTSLIAKGSIYTRPPRVSPLWIRASQS